MQNGARSMNEQQLPFGGRLATVGKAPPAAPRILVVDDNLDQVQSLAYLLKNDGHQVEFAISAAAALEIARRTMPEVVLLDVGLPDGNGAKVVELLRHIPGLEKGKARIIALTGRAISSQALIDAGFDGVVRKPLAYPELQEQLRR